MTTAATTTGAGWFRRHPAPHRPRLRLVCLPHAGGAASFFAPWRPLLPPDVELLAARYPGREDRIAEPYVTRMDDLADLVADAVTDALEPPGDLPLACFGHSMGAALAYEVTVRLEARGHGPARLFVSGREAPHRSPGGDLHRRDDTALVEEVRRLGGVGLAALDDPTLRDLVLTTLRADYTLIESYRPTRVTPVAAPVTAFAGTADPVCAVSDVRAWAHVTTGAFALRVLPGDHFFPVSVRAEVVGTVAAQLAGS
jgi:pyochelin biosynthetic protein PchC